MLLTGRILVEARRRRGVEDAVWRHLLDAIAADPSVDLAYPTIRGYVPGMPPAGHDGSVDDRGR